MLTSKNAPWIVAAAASALAGSVFAAPATPSIAVKFGADAPNAATSSVAGPAGLLNTATWNNENGANQAVPQILNADVGGALTPTSATVTWSSNGTWSSTGLGEENNTATGQNHNLMAGYLDTGGLGQTGVSITFANLPAVSPAYDVYVYIQGGVNSRGGTYTIGSTTIEHTVTSSFNGTFLQDTLPVGTTANSNYIVFHNLTGSSFTLNTVPTIGSPERAPVNAVEIVAVPEPASVALLGLGGLALLARRRRQSRA
jgi:hypothetical protein